MPAPQANLKEETREKGNNKVPGQYLLFLLTVLFLVSLLTIINHFNLIDIGDGSFFLVPKESKVMKNADKVAKKIKEANVTLEDLLVTLDEERKTYYKEHYVKN